MVTKKKRKARSPNLRGADIGKIVTAIKGLRTPVTWVAVVEAAEEATKARYTRHALAAHPEIAAAYTARKFGGPPGPGGQRRFRRTVAADAARDGLKEEVKALRAAIWKYEELFITILANAYALNVSEDRLFAPLPDCGSRSQ